MIPTEEFHKLYEVKSLKQSLEGLVEKLPNGRQQEIPFQIGTIIDILSELEQTQHRLTISKAQNDIYQRNI